ncbi:MAG: D-alanyl-D-alanine carboxypeptidase, partial [Actinomycetota bacterium]|nr:D-alanyl-D-alanine carboxypeptidase [Actinomycetota bacterium]
MATRGAKKMTLAAVTATCLAFSPAASATAATTTEPSAKAGLKLTTPLLSLSRVPDFVLQTVASQRVQSAIGTLWGPASLGTGTPTSCLEVSQGAQVLIADNPSTGVIPASNMKLLTATAALDKLGAGYRFTTMVKADRGPVGGVVDGNLYFIGGGDPLLRTPAYAAALPYPEPTYTSLVQLAAQVRAAGVRRIVGDIVGDESRYDRQRGVPSWKAAYTIEGDVGPLSALQVDDGFERVTPPPAPPSTPP